MISVTHLDGRCEPLNNIQGAVIKEEVNGDFTLSFTSLSINNPGYDLLVEESSVEQDGHEFKVKVLEEKNGRKQVAATHVYFDLIDEWRPDIFGGTKTIQEVATWLLSGTGWTWEIQGVIPAAFLPNYGEGNVLALLRTACETFECEVAVLPNRHLVFAKQIGEDNDQQFRFKHNIKTLSRKIDTTNLVTVGRGKGANGLEVEWLSPNIALYGERYGEPIVDERFTITESLAEKVRQNTQDTPQVSLVLEVNELRNNGYTGGVGLGDSVWIIYEPMDILVQLRVLGMKSYPGTNKSPVITLSNVKTSLTDQLTETNIKIDENQKETRSKIEQTNERITLEVDRIDDSLAQIVIEADNIKLSVTDLSGRLGNAEATILIQADQISSKVSQTDFNGNTIASLINQTATTVLIEAQNIKLSGITEVANQLNIGTPGSGGDKSLIFSNYSGIDVHDSTSMELIAFGNMYLNANEVRFDGYFGGQGAIVDLSTARQVTYGDNAPVARFG